MSKWQTYPISQIVENVDVLTKPQFYDTPNHPILDTHTFVTTASLLDRFVHSMAIYYVTK